MKPSYEITGKGEGLVLIHGWSPASTSIGSKEVKCLSRHYRVLNFDLRDYSLITPANQVTYSLKGIVDDLRETMNRHKIRKAHICSFGWGTFVAQGLQVYYPERVKSQVFVGYPGGTAGENDGLPAEPIPALIVLDRQDDTSVQAAMKLQRCFVNARLSRFTMDDHPELFVKFLHHFFQNTKVQGVQQKLIQLAR